MIKVLLNSVRRFVRKYFRVNVYLLEGNERESGEKLKILYGGGNNHLEYIADLFFVNPPAVSEMGGRWIWVPARMGRQECFSSFLVIVDIQKNIYRLFASSGDIFVPHWVGGEVNVSEALDRTKISANIKKDLRRLKKNKLTYKVVKKTEDFESFFHDMYVPYMDSAYAQRAFLMSYKEMMDKAGRNELELLLVEKDGQEIAGNIIVYEQGRARGWSVGVKDGNREYVKAGALAALYYFKLLYLSDKNINKLHFGGSRAFLKNGVLQFKKKWWMRLTDSTRTGFLLIPNESSVGIKEFWKNNPFIFCRKGEFEGVVFLELKDGLTKELLLNLKKQYFLEGMTKLNVLLIGEGKEKLTLPSQLPENVEIIQNESLM